MSFLVDFGVIFHWFWGGQTEWKSDPQTCRFFRGPSTNKSSEKQKIIEAWNMEILQITRQGAVFQHVHVFNILDRCGKAWWKNHSKNRRIILGKSSESCQQNGEIWVGELLLQKAIQMTRFRSNMWSKMGSKWQQITKKGVAEKGGKSKGSWIGWKWKTVRPTTQYGVVPSPRGGIKGGVNPSL